MTGAPVIPRQPPDLPGLDYGLLRREGISFLEKLAGTVWTDYNTHDPGVTILELLCYVVTDLSYRLGFDIRDILAEAPDSPAPPQFLTARQVLTVNPVTIDDYRKLVIDVGGVRNAWLETAAGPLNTRGYYRVFVEPEPAMAAAAAATLAARVRTRLSASRNLCEDFLEIAVLPPEDIRVAADISLEDSADADTVLGDIYDRLAGYISPEIPFLALDEMLACGYSPEEIFEGPRLSHGFIDPADLRRAERKTQLHASDLVPLLRDIPGVRAVENLRMRGASGKWHTWALDLTPGRAPRLGTESRIRLFKGSIPCTVTEAGLRSGLTSGGESRGGGIGKRELDFPVPAGTYRDLNDYETIQNELPLNYGVGYFGLPDDASPRRKALANQLRAYLMLFDQVLSNYFAQLEQAKRLLSPAATGASYFAGALPEEVEAVVRQKAGVRGEDETFVVKLLAANNESCLDALEPLVSARERRATLARELQAMMETPQEALRRHNRFLDHLLARYAEKFTDGSLLFQSGDLAGEYLAAKQEFLRHYPAVSGDRARAFDYTRKAPVWDSDNVSGLELRIALELGITGFMRRKLAGTKEEGFHLVEHILLPPTAGEEENAGAENPASPDDYSFHLSFIFPDWAGRFREEPFRRFVEGVVAREVPVHLRAAVHWRNREFFREFERWYGAWLERKAEDTAEARKAARRLAALLGIGSPGRDMPD